MGYLWAMFWKLQPFVFRDISKAAADVVEDNCQHVIPSKILKNLKISKYLFEHHLAMIILLLGSLISTIISTLVLMLFLFGRSQNPLRPRFLPCNRLEWTSQIWFSYKDLSLWLELGAMSLTKASTSKADVSMVSFQSSMDMAERVRPYMARIPFSLLSSLALITMWKPMRIATSLASVAKWMVACV